VLLNEDHPVIEEALGRGLKASGSRNPLALKIAAAIVVAPKLSGLKSSNAQMTLPFPPTGNVLEDVAKLLGRPEITGPYSPEFVH
jgi:hypothetical protein